MLILDKHMDFYPVWMCLRCSKMNYQSFYLHSKTKKVNTTCKYCKAKHNLNLSDNKPILDISEHFCNMELQRFVSFIIPDKNVLHKDIELLKNNPEKHNISKVQLINAWCEHDALHYLFNESFTYDGEVNVASLEKYFNCGFYPYDKKYNSFYNENIQKDLDSTTIIEIMNIANIIKQLILSL